MTLLIGIGQAGGAIVDQMMDPQHFKHFSKAHKPLAINSTIKDLQSLKHIPRSNWLGLSETKGIVPGPTPGIESMVVGGFGKDPRLAQERIGKNMEALIAFFKDFAARETGAANLTSKTRNVATDGDEWEVTEQDVGTIPDAVLFLGFGGGTGCGTAALIAKALREASAGRTTIIVVGILPATHEGSEDGARGTHRQAWNTIFALDELEKVADGFILVDNERLAYAGEVERLFPDFNAYVARAMADLLAAHLLDDLDLAKAGNMSLKVTDVRDIASAISFGTGDRGRRPGYASIGWAADTTRKYRGYLLPGLGRRNVDCTALLEVALRKQSIQDVRPEEAQKNLGLVRLPLNLAKNPRFFPQTGQVEAKLGKMSRLQETHFGITIGRRPIVSVNTLLTFERKQLTRLQQISDLAMRYNAGGVLGL
ncbi:MAG: hypothetical protein V4510_05660 [bacterium]